MAALPGRQWSVRTAQKDACPARGCRSGRRAAEAL